MSKLAKILLITFLIGTTLAACAPTNITPTATAVPSIAPSVVPPVSPTAVPISTSRPAPTNPVVQPSLQVATVAPTQTGGLVKKGNVLLQYTGVAYDQNLKQVVLNLSGSLPTPCHQLQADISKPDAQKDIQVNVYTLVDPNLNCTQVIKAFETSYPLGSLPSGSYTVFVNGEKAGQAQVP